LAFAKRLVRIRLGKAVILHQAGSLPPTGIVPAEDCNAALGIVPMPLTPAECQTFITAEVEKWANVIKFASIKPE
jgi:hypothetical protein